MGWWKFKGVGIRIYGILELGEFLLTLLEAEFTGF
jgi:hypothetical protein